MFIQIYNYTNIVFFQYDFFTVLFFYENVSLFCNEFLDSLNKSFWHKNN